MLRSQLAVWVAAVAILGMIVGAVAYARHSAGGDGDTAARGPRQAEPPPGGPAGVNARIVGLEELFRPSAAPEIRPVRPAQVPAPPPAQVNRSGAGSAGAPVTRMAPTSAPPAQCAQGLLQSILGLGVTLLGGRPGC